ncbi:isopentenyl-diphosphate Delta-isomerase [Nocardia mexicana]|uniref:Isopentenyl-diphosphate Delta-isomerase n=1 Tax=Nocardia mexicana TaxID=279262 RepID=A0A370H0R0_9NOCA|nr:isopentenyl-diphosphate Delta-isomerase [Nocardia mexicana]RDI49590.1 isopentenyl-diphosphate delta-isomerase [Nocardia mexicana]
MIPEATTAIDRETLPVELVDEQGRPTGACPVAQAHTAPGRLHRAFSVLLFDADGRVLLQQRAGVKTRFPLLWTNTCCGHPAPDTDVTDAAAERLVEELGIRAALTEVGTFTYRAADPETSRVEYEWDHVLVGRFDGEPPRPDPAEIAAHTWMWPTDLQAAMAADPDAYTPWLSGVLAVISRSEVSQPQ